MVISPERPSWPVDPMAATAAPRDKSQADLPHAFSSPVLKRWGNQRLLRFSNVNRRGESIGGGGRRSPPSEHRRSRPGRGGGGGLEELRAKLLGHLREAADRMKLVGAAPMGAEVGTPSPEAEGEPSSSAAVVRPWNLRARRAACKAPVHPPLPAPGPAERSMQERALRLRSEDPERKKERPRFSVSLSREEIEEDVFALTGSRPRRRPKKRPKIVRRLLDSGFPGLWLTEITADSYKVDE